MNATIQKQATVWGIRAGGQHFDASKMFRDGCIGIGWPAIGDLSGAPNDKAVILERLKRSHTHLAWTERQFSLGAAALRCLVHIVQPLDYVVYHDKSTSKVYIGSEVGPYRYAPNHDAAHQRTVQWKRIVPYASLSIEAKNQLHVRGHTFWQMHFSQEFMRLVTS